MHCIVFKDQDGDVTRCPSDISAGTGLISSIYLVYVVYWLTSLGTARAERAVGMSIEGE